MNEVMVKTHLIITDIHDEYHIKWCGSIKDTTPLIENGKPVFVFFCNEGSVEMNAVDVKYWEDVAS